MAGDDLQLIAPTSAQWYLLISDDPQLKCIAPAEMDGRNLSDFLPQGMQQKKWRQLLTELQMLLHDHEVNRQREQQGKPLINSLWLWGAGQLPESPLVDWQLVCSDSSLVRGLALLAEKNIVALPKNTENIVQLIARPQKNLVVMNQLQELNINYKSEQWTNYIKELDELWIQPALVAIKNKNLKQLTLYTDHGLRFTLHKNNLSHWWNKLPWMNRN